VTALIGATVIAQIAEWVLAWTRYWADQRTGHSGNALL